MSRHVLVPMGPNDASETALEYALREFPGTAITVVHVTASSDPLGLFGSRDPEDYVVPDQVLDLEDKLIPDPNAFNRAQRKRAERAFARAREVAAGTEIELVIRSGDPVDEIVTYVAEKGVDHVVIGKHRPTELRPVLRSVAEAVARTVDVPVTIVS